MRHALVLLVLVLQAHGCAASRSGQQQREPVLVAGDDEMVLQLECQPKQAEVSIDGVWQGNCENLAQQRLRLAPGSHQLRIQAPGYRPYAGMVEARGMLQKLTVSLSKRSPQ